MIVSSYVTTESIIIETNMSKDLKFNCDLLFFIRYVSKLNSYYEEVNNKYFSYKKCD